MKTIKVIKRNERAAQNAPEAAPATKANRVAAKDTAREMVATVSTWVNEFQQRRRTETKRAFHSLFVDQNPQPTEV